MRKIALILGLILSLLTESSSAQTLASTTQESRKSIIKVTSFPDYFPFSHVLENYKFPKLKTVFDESLENFAKHGNYEIERIAETDYNKSVHNVRRGNIDLLLGIYYSTQQYSGLDYLFPAVMHNPIHVAMLPANIQKVNNLDDLKKLKGIYAQNEHFSDYMLNNFKNLNITPVATSYDAYEQLFTGKADFIVGSYYYNYAYVLDIGLKDYVSFSKKSLWNMPLFLGLSKASKISGKLKTTLNDYIVSDEFITTVEQSLHNIMREREKDSLGRVPPKFVRQESLTELTPADEQENNRQAN